MATMELLRSVGHDEADRQLPADAQDRLHEPARAWIGVMQVLEGKDHDAIAGAPGEDTENRFHKAARLLVWRRAQRVGRDEIETREPIRERGHQCGHLEARPADDAGDPLIRQGLEARRDGRGEGRVRHALQRPIGGSTQDDDIGQVGEARLKLGQEPADTDACRPGQRDPCRLQRGGALQASRKTSELAFPADETHRPSIRGVSAILRS